MCIRPMHHTSTLAACRCWKYHHPVVSYGCPHMLRRRRYLDTISVTIRPRKICPLNHNSFAALGCAYHVQRYIRHRYVVSNVKFDACNKNVPSHERGVCSLVRGCAGYLPFADAFEHVALTTLCEYTSRPSVDTGTITKMTGDGSSSGPDNGEDTNPG